MAEDDERNEDGGLSTPQKVVAGAALGVAVPAAVGVARKLLGGSGDDGSEESGGDEPRAEHEQEEDERASSEPISRERRSTTRRAAPKRTQTRTRTREQLYKQATRLKIAGRSSMNKAELERAVDRAKAKAKSKK